MVFFRFVFPISRFTPETCTIDYAPASISFCSVIMFDPIEYTRIAKKEPKISRDNFFIQLPIKNTKLCSCLRPYKYFCTDKFNAVVVYG